MRESADFRIFFAKKAKIFAYIIFFPYLCALFRVMRIRAYVKAREHNCKQIRAEINKLNILYNGNTTKNS